MKEPRNSLKIFSESIPDYKLGMNKLRQARLKILFFFSPQDRKNAIVLVSCQFSSKILKRWNDTEDKTGKLQTKLSSICWEH